MADLLDLLALPIVDKNGNATPYFEDVWYSVVDSLGGEGAPSISTITIIESEDSQSFQSNVKTLKRSVFFNDRVEIVDCTAVDNDFIEANSSIIVYLPLNPRKSSQVIVANGDGSVITVDGNGNDIKFTKLDTELKIRTMGTTIVFQWFQDGPYWRPR